MYVLLPLLAKRYLTPREPRNNLIQAPRSPANDNSFLFSSMKIMLLLTHYVLSFHKYSCWTWLWQLLLRYQVHPCSSITCMQPYPMKRINKLPAPTGTITYQLTYYCHKVSCFFKGTHPGALYELSDFAYCYADYYITECSMLAAPESLSSSSSLFFGSILV